MATRIGPRVASKSRQIAGVLLLTVVACHLISSVRADAAAGDLKLTEAELTKYDGTNPEDPIYLAIDGTIFDVSASPTFYGPGGHYRELSGEHLKMLLPQHADSAQITSPAKTPRAHGSRNAGTRRTR